MHGEFEPLEREFLGVDSLAEGLGKLLSAHVCEDSTDFDQRNARGFGDRAEVGLFRPTELSVPQPREYLAQLLRIELLVGEGLEVGFLGELDSSLYVDDHSLIENRGCRLSGHV